MSADVIFQKNLQDIVKGIRNHKKDVGAYISQVIADAKVELKSTDTYVKSEAVRKLTYLQSLGYNISWASFAIVEVMSQAKFGHKRIGYLAANQSFNDSTDVILLTTNLFKKEMGNITSSNHYDVGLAINCLSNIVTNDLARDCMSDVVKMMSHQKAYVRKKAVLSMFKLYIKYPQGLRLTFEKLKEHLDDNDGSVVSCVVNVICELSNKNAKNYVSMAPKFFSLLTTSTNNWMLIKLVKLMGSLVPEEPRLARKLLDPLAAIIQSSPAKSIQYECINTITEALLYTKREDGTDAKSVPAVVKLCANYLRNFIEDSDPNLKFLGLTGLNKLMMSHPRSIVEQREVVLRCLNDPDVTLRIKALELLAGIVTKKNLIDLVHHLLDQATNHAEGNFRNEIIRQILVMGSKDKFSNVEDFAWYISVLSRLAVVPGSGQGHGKEVSDQLIEVVVRVESVRPYAVECMLSILLDQSLLLGHARLIVCEVLKAAVWIIGEYSSTLHFIKLDAFSDEEIASNEDLGYWIEGPLNEDVRSAWRGKDVHSLILETLLHPRATNLPNVVQSAYLMSALKVFIRTCVDEHESDIAIAVGIIRSHLQVFLQSHNMEIQERASTLRHLLSELEILSLNWHANAAIEESKSDHASSSPNSNYSSSSSSSDLLDFDSPLIYTAGSVKVIDNNAARIAVMKKSILLAAISEPFYPVHPKAQKKVPIPEGIDMSQSISSSAMKKVMGLELPNWGSAAVSLANLSFVKIAADRSASFYEEESRESSRFGGFGSSSLQHANQNLQLLGSGAFEGGGILSPNSSIAVSSMSATYSSSSNRARNADESLFYLSTDNKGSNDNLDAQGQGQGRNGILKPLSQIFDIDASSKKKSKKSKDKDKSAGDTIDTARRGATWSTQGFDNREMLPAGALASDEEDETDEKRRKAAGSSSSSTSRRTSRNNKDNSSNNKNSNRNNASDGDLLGHVDITTPLEDHEVLSDRKHREVFSSVAPVDNNSSISGSGNGNGNGDLMKQRDKSGKRKKKDKEGASKVTNDFDLLNFESSTTTNNSNNNNNSNSSSNNTNNKAQDQLSMGRGELPEPHTIVGKRNNSVWMPLVTSDKYEVLYSMGGVTKTLIRETEDDMVLNVLIKVINYSKAPLSVDFFANSNNQTLIRSKTLFPTSASTTSSSSSLPSIKPVNICKYLRGNTSQSKRQSESENVTSWDLLASSDTLASHFLGNAEIEIAGICKASFHDSSEQLISMDVSLGVSVQTMQFSMKICECFTFNSDASSLMTAEGIENILLKSNHNCGSAKVVLPLTIKWKSAIKVIAGFVNGVVVENNQSAMNASIYTQTPSSGHVCMLLKSKSLDSGASVGLKVEVKCVGASKRESQTVASNLIQALQSLSL